MTHDMATILNDLAGKPFTIDGKELTLGRACTLALLAPTNAEVSSNDKFNRYSLAKLTNKETETLLPLEDITLIKKLVGEQFGPALMGAIYDALDGTAE